MPNSRQTSVIASPSSTRATKHRRSSITELAFHGINTSRQKAKSVTHVSGTKCHPCLRPHNSNCICTRVICLRDFRLCHRPDVRPDERLEKGTDDRRSMVGDEQ